MGHFIAASELRLVPPLNTSTEKKCHDLGRYSFLSIVLRYNFPRYSVQGSFAYAHSSDACVETKIYGHCFMQSLTYLTKHAHTQERNSPLFHLHLRGMQVFPKSLLDGLVKVEGATQAQKPPEVTGAFTGTPQCAEIEHRVPLAQRKSSPAAVGRWFRFTENA